MRGKKTSKWKPGDADFTIVNKEGAPKLTESDRKKLVALLEQFSKKKKLKIGFSNWNEIVGEVIDAGDNLVTRQIEVLAEDVAHRS